MNRVFAKQALARGQHTVAGWDYRLWRVFSGEASACGMTARVEDEGTNFICGQASDTCIYNLLSDVLGAYLQRIRPSQEPEWEEVLPWWGLVVVAMYDMIRNSRRQSLECRGRMARAMVMEGMRERGAKMVVVE